jgi:hypothetical protein
VFDLSLCHVRALPAFLDCPFLNASPVFSLKCSSFVHLDISIISNGGILDAVPVCYKMPPVTHVIIRVYIQ